MLTELVVCELEHSTHRLHWVGLHPSPSYFSCGTCSIVLCVCECVNHVNQVKLLKPKRPHLCSGCKDVIVLAGFVYVTDPFGKT